MSTKERPPVVIPSSMRFYTFLPLALIRSNPQVATMVIAALNRVDRGRNDLFREVIGDKQRARRKP